MVTGADSGIGRASSQALAAEGALVVVTDYNDIVGENTVKLILEFDGQATFKHLDVADVDQIAEVVHGIATECEGLHIAVNSVGIEGSPGPLAGQSIEDLRRDLEVNVLCVAACMQAKVKAMRAYGGSIINIAAALGLIGGDDRPVYTASKHAVVGPKKASATDYAKHGIWINAIAPGAIDIGISKLSKAQAQHLLLDTPLDRAGQAEEIADAVVWLASDRSSYVLGHTLPVDGGVVVGSTATKRADVA